MKNWYQERNYRRVRDEHGDVVANIITVDGVDVEVTEKVYLAYSSMERRERYQDEAKADNGFLSLEQMAEDEVRLEYVCADTVESSEDTILYQFEQTDKSKMLVFIQASLELFSDSDRELIEALLIKGVGVREYAREKGVYDRAIRKRRDRILRELKEILKKYGFEGTH